MRLSIGVENIGRLLAVADSVSGNASALDILRATVSSVDKFLLSAFRGSFFFFEAVILGLLVLATFVYLLNVSRFLAVDGEGGAKHVFAVDGFEEVFLSFFKFFLARDGVVGSCFFADTFED